MDDTRTICAVVVTYNRVELLDTCLEAIVAQSRHCDRIIVIDNASTDETLKMLADKWADRVEVHSLARNVGAAGGFAAGMRLAYRSGADAIWVMDDDVIAEPDTLERLVSADRLLKARGIDAPFVISTAWTPKGRVTNVPKLDDRKNELSYEKWSALLEYRMVPVRRATFVSILLPRETLGRYGLPIASMFIWGEDSEYTLRVTAEKPGYLVGDSRTVHVRQADGNPSIRTEHDPIRIGYHYYLIRNRVYRKRKYETRLKLAHHLLSQIKLIASLCARQEFTKAKIVFRGLRDGLTFNPVIEPADAPFDEAGARTLSLSEPQAVPLDELLPPE